MIYASIEDIWKRKGTDISDTDYVTALLEDAAIIIDAYNRNATDEAKKFVADNGYDPVYGARPLKRYIQKYVETLSAKLILEDKVDQGDIIYIDVDGDHLTAGVKKP